MATYIVTSHRLVGYEPGDIIEEGDMNGSNIQALIEGGHISTQSDKKSAKPKITETED
jgi:hypothetical protein